MENLEKETSVNGFMDFIKSAVPTIGKVVGGLLSAVTNEDGQEQYRCVHIHLGKAGCGKDETMPLVNQNGRIIAYNTSLDKDLTLNFPRKLDRYNGEVLVLEPFTKMDVTDCFTDCSSNDVERFNVQSTNPSDAVSSDGLLSGIVSCVGYITKKMIEGRVFKLTSHIFLQIVGKDLKITLASGMALESAPSITLSVKDGAENKKYLNIQAQPEVMEYNDGGNSTGVILLENALDGYNDDDELELDVTVRYAAPKDMRICDRKGVAIVHDDLAILRQVAR